MDGFLLGSVIVPAAERLFVARDHLVSGVDKHDKVMASTGSYFTRWFLDGVGVVEAPSDEVRIDYHQLVRDMANSWILEEFGDEKRVETKLQIIWHLLSLQVEGYPGTLLVNNCGNVFYVRDKTGVLRVVSLSWSILSRSWYLTARRTASFLGANVRVFIPHKN